MSSLEFEGNEVTIMACSDCNTRCKHCYIGYSGNFYEESLYNLCSLLIRKYRVTLNGTELLLHPEFFESMRLVGQDFIITNGLELVKKPELIQELLSIGIKYVGISYHFFIHDKISSIDPTIVEPLLKKLKQSGIIADIRVTITSENYDRIEEICDLTYKMGATGIKFTNYLYVGAATKLKKSNVLTDGQLNIFFEQLEKVRSKYNKEDFLIRRCGSFGNSKNRIFKCPAITDSVVITPDLKVYPCIFMARKGMEIGAVEAGKIIIDSNCQINNNCCTAKEIFNGSC